ncbi:hypothetical protein CR513_44588, partial [Mucuna pruriens]
MHFGLIEQLIKHHQACLHTKWYMENLVIYQLSWKACLILIPFLLEKEESINNMNLMRRELQRNDEMYNDKYISINKIILGQRRKLKSKWSNPFVVKEVVNPKSGNTFKVNG